MALVLSTGIDSVLMKPRQLILESAGHTVVRASDEREIKAVCSRQKFDVAVIGQHISPNSQNSRGRPCTRALSGRAHSGAYPPIREQGAEGRRRLA